MTDPRQPDDSVVPLLEESAEDLYEAAPCGYLSVLPDGTITRVNQTFLDWTGYQRTNLLGQRVQTFYTVGSRIYYETHLGPLLHMQGELRGIALEFRRADGSRLDTLVNAVLRRNLPNGSPMLRMTVFDATDRRSYERELLDERRRAELNAARIRVLQEMVARCAAVERAEDIAAPIVAAVTEAFGVASPLVWLRHPEEDRLTVAGSDALAFPLDSADPVARAVRTGDVVAPIAFGPERRVVTPLISGGRVLGAVSFEIATGRQLAADEVDLLRTVGQQAGQALERVRLHEETIRRGWQSAFLARLGRDLDEAVSPADRARQLVTLLVPEVAEFAQVHLSRRENADTIDSLSLPDVVGPVDDLIAHGTAEPWPISEEVQDVMWAGALSGRITQVPLAGPDGRDALVLPLRARSAVMGVLLLAGEPSVATRFGQAFLLEVAGRAGLALDNALLAEQDRTVARTFQRSLLVSERPTDPRFHVVTDYRPAVESLEVGGDWYDTFTTSTGSIGVVVGDVVGRGIGAACAMGQLRSAVRALAKAHHSPAKVLGHMDDFVATLQAGQMTTLAYAELALDTGVLRYACAGHPPPLLLPPRTPPRYLWEGRSGPLGTHAARRSRREAELTLPRGARLLLYTDGLVERRAERIDQGFDRLSDVVDVNRSASLAAMTRQVADAMLDGEGGHDDTCLLALAFDGAPQFHAEVPAQMSQLRPLRAKLDQWLTAYRVSDQERYGIVLSCSEAVANAIEHGYQGDPVGVVSVTATIDGGILDLRISDSGRWQAPRASADRGRGMALMGQLMDDLVVDRGKGTNILLRRKFRGMTG